MAAKKVSKAFDVVITRDEDGWFVATVPSLDGCHTQGRSIAQAVTRAREAMTLYDLPATNPITIAYAAPIGRRVERLIKLRARSEKVAKEAQDATQQLAAELVAQGLSVRDVGALLELSFQRVQQLVKAAS